MTVIYNSVGVQVFHAPPLHTSKGKWIWAVLVPIYWSIAYVIGGAIPAFSGFVALVSAICIMQFTYSFPPLLYMGYMTQKNAVQAGEGFDPSSGKIIRHDSGIKRLMRGFFAEKWYFNVLALLYMLGALATAGLGIWAAIENMILIYAEPQLNAFVCKSPLDTAA